MPNQECNEVVLTKLKVISENHDNEARLGLQGELVQALGELETLSLKQGVKNKGSNLDN